MFRADLEQDDNIYIRQPSRETDDAWNSLEYGVASWATSKDLRAAGKDPSLSIQLPTSMGLGEDAYPIVVDIKHRIHCLNRIRKDLYFDYYYHDAFPGGNVTELHRLHTNHCLLLLLKSLICAANTDFAAFSWYEEYHQPLADFNIERKCGDFDGIDRWARARRIDQRSIYEIPKAANMPTRPMSAELREKLGQIDGETNIADI